MFLSCEPCCALRGSGLYQGVGFLALIWHSIRCSILSKLVNLWTLISLFEVSAGAFWPL